MSEFQKELDDLKKQNEAPEWYNVKSYTTVSRGYRLKGETPNKMYRRVAKTAAKYIKKPELEDVFYDVILRNWLCPASPVLSNSGTDRGLPISCFGIDLPDHLYGITGGVQELAMLTKNGGGVGVGFNRIRPKGTDIAGGANGQSDGIIPFAKIYDSAISGISQGSTRRGAASINLSAEHEDWSEFVRMRRPEGDVDRQCTNLHHCGMFSDEFMQKVGDGDYESRVIWAEHLITRMETGEPYTMFTDAVNRANPPCYKDKGFEVSMTNICSEITLFTDEMHSFICCLSSLNLVRFDEWKDAVIEGMTLPEIATYFLNGILNEFIEKASKKRGLEKVVASAIKGRAIGIGVLGWHTLLQEKMLPFNGFEAMMLNNEIFRNIKTNATKATEALAKEFGEPEWCEGHGVYNSHLMAIAPTRSNSIISGGVSAGVEPIIRNAYTDKTAKGAFIEKNPKLEEILIGYDKNTEKVWDSISQNSGSCQHLEFLTDHERKVFRTAYEIDQKGIIRQAAQRQQWVCQAQSINTFFPQGTDPLYFNECHYLAWKVGLKTLYYCRSTSGLKMDNVSRPATIQDECESCSG